jgi:hypothetical protein
VRLVDVEAGGPEHEFAAGRLAATLAGAAAVRVRRVENAGQLAAFEARARAVRGAARRAAAGDRGGESGEEAAAAGHTLAVPRAGRHVGGGMGGMGARPPQPWARLGVGREAPAWQGVGGCSDG